jgi:hypothetical protein
MINYNYYQLENTDWVIFNLDKESTMFILSDEKDENGNYLRGLPEHGKMIEDFKDKTNLEYFIQLLIDNPSTAFSIYNNL